MVLQLASEGQTNVEIATLLHISRHTVAQHIAKMLRRTGALNRTDLVTRAYKAGALPSTLLRPGGVLLFRGRGLALMPIWTSITLSV
jgi:orotate phosphoribosyltransferase-like protein